MTTLKISDLSVGDWVRCRDRNGRIEGLEAIRSDERVRVSVESYLGTMFLFVGIEDIEPIPITAKILEANGWKKGQRGEFYHYLRLDKNSTLYVHASTNGWRVEITYDAAGILRTTHLMPDMNSVHDLQHALRLAGVDKEINL